MLKVHKHLVIHGYLESPPMTSDVMNDWLIRLVEKIDMNILMGPFSIYCDKENNRGVTGSVIIDTSHICFHAWDEPDPSEFQLDVFSCKEFDISDVYDMLKEFKITDTKFSWVDRDSLFTK